jgi:hypothetical protein
MLAVPSRHFASSLLSYLQILVEYDFTSSANSSYLLYYVAIYTIGSSVQRSNQVRGSIMYVLSISLGDYGARFGV